MEVKYRLVPVEPNDEQQLAGAQAIRIETTQINKMFTANRVYRDMISVIPDQPSDLEIVQKALEKSGSRLSIASGGEWIAEKDIDTVTGSGYDTESLLAWAKHTIGVE